MSEKQQKKSSGLNKKALGLVVLIALVVGGYVFLNINSAEKNHFKNIEIQKLENEIKVLEKTIRNMQKNNLNSNDLVMLNEKINDKNKENEEILNSKASVSALMGVIERVDRLEKQVQNLGKVTSQNALILTAAALTDEAAKTGEAFVYEASVLEELSKGTAVQESAEIVASFAPKGLPSREDLIEKFIKIYEESFLKPTVKENALNLPANEEETAKDWKDKTVEKLKNLVVVKKIEPNKNSTRLPIDEVYRLVREGNFEEAMIKMDSDQKYQTENFEIWKEEVRAQKTFDKEMKKIRAVTLGLMKTETLKEE